MIFIPFASRADCIDNYTGFVFFLENKENDSFIKVGSYKQIVTKEILDEGIVRELNSFNIISSGKAGTTLYLDRGRLFQGDRRFMRSLYLDRTITFQKKQLLEETDFIENVFDHKFSLNFINNHINQYKEVLNDEYESYETYIFSHMLLPRFISDLYDMYQGSKLSEERVAGVLKEFNNICKVNMEFSSINDYLYYLESLKKENKKISFDKFKRITMHFLY